MPGTSRVEEIDRRVGPAARYASSRIVHPRRRHIAHSMRHVLPIFAAALSVAAHATDLPNAMLPQLPPGYQVMVARKGPDIDASRTSYLVVLHRSVDSMSDPSPRPLAIFEQQVDGSFRLAARNDEVVLRADEGGQCDPFDPDDASDSGLAGKGRFFTVQNFVACGQHWSPSFPGLCLYYPANRHPPTALRLFAQAVRDWGARK